MWPSSPHLKQYQGFGFGVETERSDNIFVSSLLSAGFDLSRFATFVRAPFSSRRVKSFAT